jgi:tetratricopeptide (TPR) repeat protein
MNVLRDNDRIRWRGALLLAAAGLFGVAPAQTGPPPNGAPAQQQPPAPAPETSLPESTPAPADSAPAPTDAAPAPADSAPAPTDTAPPSARPAGEPAPAQAAAPAEHEITPAETEATRAQTATAGETPGPTAADAAAPASRSDAYAEFRRLFDERKYAQALAPAQQVVTLTEQLGDAEELQIALMNLAATQSLTSDFVTAEATYLRVIELIEAGGTRASPRLARANAGLAVAYHDAGSHELAVARFEQALALARRSEGLFDEGQLPLLDKYTDSLTYMWRVDEAHEAQRYGLRIVERKHGRSSPEIVPRLETISRWYTRIGAYDSARLTLRRAISIVERSLGENSVELIGPLTALAENYRRPLLNPADRGFETSASSNNAFNTIPGAADGSNWRLPSALAAEGERALERALAIAESQPRPEQARIADVRTQLGDWYQTRLQHDKAMPHYLAAWSAAHQVKLGDATLADSLFSQPVLLHYVRPSEWDRFEHRPAEEVSPHTVELELTVTAEGRVRNAEVVANDGSPQMAEAMLDAAETARYRPRFIDGKPLETADVRLAQTFFEPNPVPETPTEPASSDTPGQAGGA